MLAVGFSSAIALYKTLDTIMPKREEVMAKDKLLQKDLEYFKENIKKVKSLDEFFDNYKLLEIALRAYGLESEIQKKAFIKKVLTSDPNDVTSLMNRVRDSRYREMAADFLLHLGNAKFRTDSLVENVTHKLIATAVEKQLDQQAPGIRQAIHFKRAADAGDINGPYDLLSNPVLRDVALGARNIPIEIVFQEVEAQGRTLERFFDFNRFSDPVYVDRIIQQYLVQADLQNAQAGQGETLNLSLPGSAGGGSFNLIV